MIKKICKIVLGIGFATFVFLGLYSFTVVANTPKIQPEKIYDYLSERSVLLDDKDQVIDSVSLEGGNRTNIKYKDMPKNLINAVVSIEDKTFWKHHGFNFWRMLGAIKNSLFSGGEISGTSTITQQLARNVYLSETKSVRSLSRKISEAYYTMVIEANLSKEKIMEAYLNTIYLGNNSYGIQSAAKSYFNKDAKNLDLTESAALAALPQAPNNYALVKKVNSAEGKTGKDSKNKILHENSDFIYYYNGDASKHRRDTTLKLMLSNNYITRAQYDKAIKENLADKMNIASTVAPDSTSYFTDYLIEQVAKDLMEKYKYSREEAIEKIYTGGYTIHSTLNQKAQKSINDVFANPSNFPKLSGIRYDKNKNILSEKNKVILSPHSSYFDKNDVFTLRKDEYRKSDNGDLVLLKNKRLKFITTKVNGKTDYSIDFKDLYKMNKGILYSIKGGTILVPQQYKSLDKDGNLVISKSFFQDKSLHNGKSQFFRETGDGYKVSKEHYKLNPTIRQPQAAMAITDYKKGHLKAMIGGRDTSGKKLYNRAIKPRQPGSSIKPLSVYSSALQQGFESASKGNPMKFKEFDKNQKTENYGDFWTAASGINDAPIKYNGKDWPKNWYPGYKGPLTMRKALEQSVNTIAVRIFQQIGSKYAIEQLKKFGITTVVEEGSSNDKNPAALALGGMSKGISPLEMSGAFGTFPNGGKRKDTVCYTKVVNRKGETILETNPKENTVLDKGVSFILQDMLVSTVNSGIAKNAKVSGQPTGGKTGTTSDSMDIWFAGFTPQYSAALWIGCDVNITINATSDLVSSLWAKVMNKATSGMGGSLLSKPDNVTSKDGEYFIKGTENGVKFNPKKENTEEKTDDDEENDNNETENKPDAGSDNPQNNNGAGGTQNN